MSTSGARHQVINPADGTVVAELALGRAGDIDIAVAAARAAAAERWRPHGFATNAEVTGAVMRRHFRLADSAMAPLRTSLDRGLLSIRGVHRAMRMAWTLADLAGRTSPDADDVLTALSFRQTELIA